MKFFLRLQMLSWITIFIAASGQNSGLATTVKIFVSSAQKKQLADLEHNLPTMELVTARPHQILDVISDCDAIIGLPYDGRQAQEILSQGIKLRWVHSTSAGVENIVRIAELQNSNITLTNAKIFQGPEIADHAFALLLTLTRNLKHYNRAMDQGWTQSTPILPFIELRGKTMLVIGLGGIGTQVAQRAAAFGMRVLGVDPKDIPLSRDIETVVTPGNLHQVLPEADVVISSVPHTPASEGMLGSREFTSMKRGVYFINVSRGKVVQTKALVDALRSGQVRAAGLDVTDPEPLPSNHPLWKMDNVIITPHIATRSDQVGARLLKLIRANIERFVTGRPLLNIVNKATGY